MNGLHREPAELSHLVEEYETLVARSTVRGEVREQRLLAELCSSGEWTREGATDLLAAVRQYGSFFLRNASALAIALDIEDGEFGY